MAFWKSFQEHNGSQEQKISPKWPLVYGEEQGGWQGVDAMEIGTSLLFVVKQNQFTVKLCSRYVGFECGQKMEAFFKSCPWSKN